ncbi:glycosyltransferase family 61 protein [Halovivax ruber]|uniref:glycosyltransferase family 61 protein n=1 Tax=Halovivax ruber TaxID=387341 RepID=UPI001494E690|nr:glycosyltransferase family 61 protein [Halovivax ruber]
MTKDGWTEVLIRRNYLPRSELLNSTKSPSHIRHGDDESRFTVSNPTQPEIRREFEPYPSEFDPDARFLCDVPDCLLIGRYALGVSSEGILSETTPYDTTELSKKIESQISSYGSYLRVFGFDSGRNVDHELECVFPLVDNGRGYYHWMTEYLPKVGALQRYDRESGVKPTVLIRSDAGSYVRESLEFVGVDPAQLEEWSGSDTRVGSLLLTQHRPHKFDYINPQQSTFALSRDDLLWVRNQVRQRFGYTENSGNRIYVSRQKANCRRVKNYGELTRLLEQFDIEPYVLEDLSFEEQMRLFSNAEVIIGPHGAGLTNMIAANDPLIVELLPDKIMKPHFHHIAKSMNFQYEPFVTTASTEGLKVDTTALEKHLRALQRPD